MFRDLYSLFKIFDKISLRGEVYCQQIMQTNKHNKRNKHSGWVIFIVAVTAFGMLGVGGIFSAIPAPVAPSSTNLPQAAPTGGQAAQNSSGTTATGVNVHDLALSCTSDAQTQYHIHPRLEIIINGAREVIPANIGIAPGCLRVLHTHDDSGTIHVESPRAADFTLADFFAVWGKTFNRNQILDSKTDAARGITMTVNGQPSSDYENLVLKDGQEIVIQYK